MLLWSYERHIPPFLFFCIQARNRLCDELLTIDQIIIIGTYWWLWGKEILPWFLNKHIFILVHDFMSAIHMDLTDYVIHLYSYVQENMFNSILTWYNDIVYRSDWNLLFIWNRRKHPYIQLIKTQIFDAVHAFKERWKR